MKRNHTSRWALALAAAVVFAAGAAVQASEIDDSIGPAFQQTYVYKAYLQNDAITTEAKEGVVTLTGTVAEEFHRTLAEETVASLPGVVRVDNQLATQTEVATANADEWIVRKVKLALMFHQNVNASATAIEAKEGVVTLKGEASSLAQKELVTEYAQDIEGVKEVVNEMTVAKVSEPSGQTIGEAIDDASITAQVRMALLTHRSTSVLSTRVSTSDGVVTVGGVAQSGAELDLVTRLVGDIHGVKRVINQMTVGEAVYM